MAKPPAKLPTIHTYAADLEVARANRNSTTLSTPKSNLVSPAVVTPSTPLTNTAEKKAVTKNTESKMMGREIASPTVYSTPHSSLPQIVNGAKNTQKNEVRDQSYAATVIRDNRRRTSTLRSRLSNWVQSLFQKEPLPKPQSSMETLPKGDTAKSTHTVFSRVSAPQSENKLVTSEPLALQEEKLSVAKPLSFSSESDKSTQLPSESLPVIGYESVSQSPESNEAEAVTHPTPPPIAEKKIHVTPYFEGIKEPPQIPVVAPIYSPKRIETPYVEPIFSAPITPVPPPIIPIPTAGTTREAKSQVRIEPIIPSISHNPTPLGRPKAAPIDPIAILPSGYNEDEADFPLEPTQTWSDDMMSDTNSQFIEENTSSPTYEERENPGEESHDERLDTDWNNNLIDVEVPPQEIPSFATAPDQMVNVGNVTESTNTSNDNVSFPITPLRVGPEHIRPIIPSTLSIPTAIPSNPPTPPTPMTAQGAPSAIVEPNISTKVKPTTLQQLRFRFSSLPFLRFTMIALFISTGLVGGWWVWQSYMTPVREVVSSARTDFNGAVLRTVVPTLLTKENIVRQIEAAKVPNNPVTEIHLLTTFNGDRIIGATIFELMGWTLAPHSRANVRHATFGYYRDTPFLLLSIQDTTSLRGGMLQWEVQMANDLTPLFTNLPRTSGRSLFVDGRIESMDVRILTSGGNEVLVYGFLNPATILVATDSVSFMNLAYNFAR